MPQTGPTGFRPLHLTRPQREQFAVLCGDCACSAIPLPVWYWGGRRWDSLLWWARWWVEKYATSLALGGPCTGCMETRRRGQVWECELDL
jgi:hypothetical protein